MTKNNDINHFSDNNVCSARAIFKELGYAKWENFNILIRRARQMITHGVALGSIKEITTPVTLGYGAIRHVVDYELDSQARDLVCLLAASFKLNGHHIARNETAILGLVKKWCEQRGLSARHQKNVRGFYVDMQVGDSLSIEFDEPHHAYQQLADRRRTMVIEKSGCKVIRFGLDCDVIDIITEIERLIPVGKMVAPSANQQIKKGGTPLLDYFAAKAMQGLLSNPGGPVQTNNMNGWAFTNCTADDVADLAYAMAEKMLQARKPK